MSLIDLPRNELRDAIEDLRFPEDPRIIVVPDLRDFALFTERKALSINGMITDYPKTKERLRELAHNYAFEAFSQNVAIFRALNQEYLNKKLYPYSSLIHPEIQEIMHNLLKAYRHAQDNKGILDQKPDAYIASFIQLHCNVQQTMSWHIDKQVCPTITMSFNQSGTICSTEPKGKGNQYAMEPGQVLLMDDQIWHKTPTKDESWDDDPRLVALM